MGIVDRPTPFVSKDAWESAPRPLVRRMRCTGVNGSQSPSRYFFFFFLTTYPSPIVNTFFFSLSQHVSISPGVVKLVDSLSSEERQTTQLKGNLCLP